MTPPAAELVPGAMPLPPWHAPRMAMKRTARPRDSIQLGKLMVDIATGQVPDAVDDGKDAGAVARASAGGSAGGKARAAALSPKQRAEIAKRAADIRWKASSDAE